MATPAATPAAAVSSGRALNGKAIGCLVPVVLLVALVGGMVHAYHSYHASHPSSILNFLQKEPLPPGYKPEPKSSYSTHDLTNVNPTTTITIHLTDGGYGDRYIFPKGVFEYYISKSDHPGDYVTFWCNGHPKPTPIVYSYTLGTGDVIEGGCRDDAHHEQSNNFQVQGQGDLVFTPTVPN